MFKFADKNLQTKLNEGINDPWSQVRATNQDSRKSAKQKVYHASLTSGRIEKR